MNKDKCFKTLLPSEPVWFKEKSKNLLKKDVNMSDNNNVQNNTGRIQAIPFNG